MTNGAGSAYREKRWGCTVPEVPIEKKGGVVRRLGVPLKKKVGLYGDGLYGDGAYFSKVGLASITAI